jgi:hypothetical protein
MEDTSTMPYDTEETQAAVAHGLTAIEHTKRGYGLWRGEVIHPASDKAAEAAESGEPITDTKGLGLRYVLVRGEKVLPHFRVHDPERFSAALDRAFPAVHDAIASVWHCRKRRLAESADLANSLLNFGARTNGKHRRNPLAATEEGIR